MTPRERLDELAEEQELDVLVADGYDEAIIGIADYFCAGHRGWRTLAVYDREKCIELLVKRDGMTDEEAREYFEFNTQGAIVDGGPIFLTKLTDNE